MKKKVLIGGLVLLHLAACGIHPGVSWHFDKDVANWHPLRDSVKLNRAVGDARSGPGCLHMTGGIAEEDFYFYGPAMPTVPGQCYRLSAWARIDSHGRYTPAPHLRILAMRDASDEPECAYRDPVPIGDFRTPMIRLDKPGQWQRIEHEWRAPPQAAALRLALKKYEGWSDMTTQIDLRLDEVRIRPIENLQAWEIYDLAPLPDGLRKAHGRHPRLLADAARFEEIARDAHHGNKHVWDRLKAGADKTMAQGWGPLEIDGRSFESGPPLLPVDRRRKGIQQTWQRPVGDNLAMYAMCYKVSGDRRYLEEALHWARFSCDLPEWGKTMLFRNNNLAAGHQMLGLALFYDWCYDDLDAQTRTAIRDTLRVRCNECFEAVVSGSAFHWESYLQNHLWVACVGMGAAGLALYDELPEARAWIGLANEKIRLSVQALGSDGVGHEGPTYWNYGLTFMLPYLFMMDDLMGEDLLDHPWWRNTADYYMHILTPRSGWKRGWNGEMLVNYADSSRRGGGQHLLRGLARRFGDARAQWWADAIEEGYDSHTPRAVYSLLWRDPTLSPEPPGRAPTVRHFEDLGIVTARPSWGEDASYLFFKCGPLLGHEAVERFDQYDAGAGHVHPDANSFALFGAGQWLLRDDFYNSRDTGGHNTLLIDGRGQMNEGNRNAILPLLVHASPRVIHLGQTEDGIVHIVADATEAYAAELGLKRFVRHAVYFMDGAERPGALVVLDDIALEEPRRLELRYRPEADVEVGSEGVCAMVGECAVMRLEMLTAQGLDVEAGTIPVSRGGHGKDRPLPGIRVRPVEPLSRWRHAVAATWAPKGETPGRVHLERTGDRWRLVFGARRATVEWKDQP